MYKYWFKKLFGFNLILPLLVIGLSYQLIGMVEEEKWVHVCISMILIGGLIVQIVLGYRKKVLSNPNSGTTN